MFPGITPVKFSDSSAKFKPVSFPEQVTRRVGLGVGAVFGIEAKSGAAL